MSQQSVRQEARRSALDAQAARRQRPHHHGRCLAFGRQPRASHRRPCPSTRAVTTTSEPGPAPRLTAGGEPAVGDGPRHPGGVQRLLGPPARPGRRSLSSRRRDGIPAVPECRFAERRPLSRISDVAVGWGSGCYCARMQAAVHTRYGPPEMVRIAEVEKPTIADNEVLVQVHATTVNRTDCACRAAKPFFMRLFTGLIRPRATVLGCEYAGMVQAVGGGVTAFSVGEKVFGYNEGPFGAHAQYLAIPEHGSITTMSANVTYEEAAPSTEGSHYALAHIKGAKITSAQDVLVYGATGAIGSAAVQLLKSLGVTVTAVCATDHVDLVKGLGADRVIDYTTEDFTNDEQTYDVVLDSVGKSSYSQCKPLLKPAGIYISSELGPHAQNPFLALIAPLQRGKRVMFPIPKHDQKMLGYLRELIESGQFKPVIDRTYRLDQIVEAYRYVETGQKIGNVVITVDHSH
jgi:NADPH:quinone reductase-like Zn-dependent oxidoreductase